MNVTFFASYPDGGLNILKPVNTATPNNSISRRLTAPITNALKGNASFDTAEFTEYYDAVVREITRTNDLDTQALFDEITSKIDYMQQRAVCRAREVKMSSW